MHTHIIMISTVQLSCKLLRMFLGAVDTCTCCVNLFGLANVSGRIGTLFDFSAVQLLCEPFLDLRTVSGRIGTLFDFSAVQLLCEPFLDLRTFLGG